MHKFAAILQQDLAAAPDATPPDTFKSMLDLLLDTSIPPVVVCHWLKVVPASQYKRVQALLQERCKQKGWDVNQYKVAVE